MDRKKELALAKMFYERGLQNEKWGIQEHDAFVWLAILMEEVGELAEVALHDRFGGDHAGILEEELIHVTAVAFQWLESMQESED